jgi:thioredoxin-like negative regulator of GroEL
MNASLRKRLSGIALAAAGLLGCGESGNVPRDAPPAADYVSASDFRRLLRESSQPVLVEFGVMSGCPRCDAVREPVERLAQELRPRVHVCRVNLAYEQGLARELGVRTCPTFMAFQGNRELFRANSSASAADLRQLLDDCLGRSAEAAEP